MVTLAGLMPGPQELIIILVIILLLFGGSRLAGLGKSTGRAIKEFKEETKSLKGKDESLPSDRPSDSPYQQTPTSTAAPVQPQDGYDAHPPVRDVDQRTQGSVGQPAERDLRRDV